MSSDEKKVVKLDEEKGEQKSIKPNEKEEEIGLLSKQCQRLSKSRQTQKYFHRKRPLLAPTGTLKVQRAQIFNFKLLSQLSPSWLAPMPFLPLSIPKRSFFSSFMELQGRLLMS